MTKVPRVRKFIAHEPGFTIIDAMDRLSPQWLVALADGTFAANVPSDDHAALSSPRGVARRRIFV
jgi:hypothetical protein